eukprot:Pgem_evm1s16573
MVFSKVMASVGIIVGVSQLLIGSADAYTRCNGNKPLFIHDGIQWVEVKARNELVTYHNIPYISGILSAGIRWQCGNTEQMYNPNSLYSEGFKNKNVDVSLMYDEWRVYWLVNENAVSASGVDVVKKDFVKQQNWVEQIKNGTRPEGCCAGAKFINADFSGLDLSHMDFYGANLTGTNFVNAKLEGVNFQRAVLKDAQFISKTRETQVIDFLADLSQGKISPQQLGEIYKQAEKVGVDTSQLQMLYNVKNKMSKADNEVWVYKGRSVYIPKKLKSMYSLSAHPVGEIVRKAYSPAFYIWAEVVFEGLVDVIRYDTGIGATLILLRSLIFGPILAGVYMAIVTIPALVIGILANTHGILSRLNDIVHPLRQNEWFRCDKNKEVTFYGLPTSNATEPGLIPVKATGQVTSFIGKPDERGNLWFNCNGYSVRAATRFHHNEFVNANVIRE